MEQHTFWLVWNPNRGAPTVRHVDEDSATREAERLARNNPGTKFYVLQARRFVEKNDVRRVELMLNDDHIPF